MGQKNLEKENLYVKGYGFLSFPRKSPYEYGKRFIGTATKTGGDSLKTALKRVLVKRG